MWNASLILVFISCFLSRKEVEFCGYNIPHPLEDKILIRVQTKQGIPAAPILLEALTSLKTVCAL